MKEKRKAESGKAETGKRFASGYPVSTLHSRVGGFTMIEIAISLAIIGFALVAIIGVLPTGMNFQKQNRQETIIAKDASIFMEAFRNGAQGTDELTNYVDGITNYYTVYENGAPVPPNIRTEGYGWDGSDRGPAFRLTNGYHIIGLLGTPKIIWSPKEGLFVSNHVVAYVHSVSGPASEKYPQSNPDVRQLALDYLLIPEITPYVFDASWISAPTNSPGYARTVAYSNIVRNLEANLHDVRLTFRWPILPNAAPGPGRQMFRTMMSGYIISTNDMGLPPTNNIFYFIQPRTYLRP